MSKDTEEMVGELKEQPPVEKVFLQDEVKLFPAKAVLMYLDGPAFDFGSAWITIPNPVPVYSHDKKKLGFATVWQQDGHSVADLPTWKRMIADLSIDYASEERLLVETGASIYARPFGTAKIAPMGFLDFQKPLKILELKIEGIQLISDAPSDTRIEPLGKPVT